MNKKSVILGLMLARIREASKMQDVRPFRQVGDLTQFQSFLRALASRSAQLISMSDLAGDLG